MYLYSIAAEHKAPLEVPHVYIDDDLYDVVEWGAAVRTTIDRTYELRVCSISSIIAIRLSSWNVFV